MQKKLIKALKSPSHFLIIFPLASKKPNIHNFQNISFDVLFFFTSIEWYWSFYAQDIDLS